MVWQTSTIASKYIFFFSIPWRNGNPTALKCLRMVFTELRLPRIGLKTFLLYFYTYSSKRHFLSKDFSLVTAITSWFDNGMTSCRKICTSFIFPGLKGSSIQIIWRLWKRTVTLYLIPTWFRLYENYFVLIGKGLQMETSIVSTHM